MTVYLDNNIIVDIENNLLSKADLLMTVNKNLNDFYYSASHIQEANEITAENHQKLTERLNKRFQTITKITDNNYLFQELPSNNVYRQKEKPSIVYETINEISFGTSAMKSMINMVSEQQKETIRNQLNIDRKRINNYSAKEVIEQINSKSNLMGGFSLVELIENAVKLNPQGKDFGLQNRIGGVFELLDMIGYWKDKYNEKSNYARLWDASHTFFSSYCNYFISNDKRTRNKAKVVYEIYGIKTKVVSSKGIE